MGPRRTLLFCVAITLLLHVVTYLFNTQLPLQIVALGGRHAQIGWLFAVTTGVAMVLRPQVGGWTDRLRRAGGDAAGRLHARRHDGRVLLRHHPGASSR